MNQKVGGFLLLAWLSMPVFAKQWGLVIGIDQYPQAAHLDHLQGAVNDAKLLADTLRSVGVDLPEERVLLNQRATLPGFRNAWAALLSQARPGDRLIVTFAGHGTQLPGDEQPEDEKADGKDEALLFYDYAADRPQAGGRLIDDALYGLLQEARAFPVTFLADTCYSGGMLRSPLLASKLPMRGDSIPSGLANWKPSEPNFAQLMALPDTDGALSHVTFLTAADRDNLRISEYRLPESGGQIHGALSWVFAQAIAGQADIIQRDGHITRGELEEYVRVNVKKASNNQQTPKLLPRGDETPAFSLAGIKSPLAWPTPNPSSALAIKVEGGIAPADIEGIRLDAEHYTLLFKLAGDRVTAYQNGDLLTEFAAKDVAAWHKLIAKYRLLSALDTLYAPNRPVTITLAEGDGVHWIDAKNPEQLTFSFDPHSTQRNLLLFNLAGTGELQMLYPKSLADTPAVNRLPYRLALNVSEPAGRDDLVAVFCAEEQVQARALLSSHDGGIAPTTAQLLNVLPTNASCQIGHYAVFSRIKKGTNLF